MNGKRRGVARSPSAPYPADPEDSGMPPTAAIGAAILRIAMGILFLCHVTLRLTVITWPVAVAFFQSLGLPAFTAYLVTLSEAAAGTLLILGLYVEAASLVGCVILIGAVLLYHINNGFFFTNTNGGWEYPAFWAVALFSQSLLGPGCWSVRRRTSPADATP